MAEAKKGTARKTTRKTSQKRAAAKPVTTDAQTASATTSEEAEAQPTEATGVQRVPAGGIDPRLVEQRERQRAEESGVRVAHAGAPATLDPKLAQVREATIARERELANRSLTKPPAKA